MAITLEREDRAPCLLDKDLDRSLLVYSRTEVHDTGSVCRVATLSSSKFLLDGDGAGGDDIPRRSSRRPSRSARRTKSAT